MEGVALNLAGILSLLALLAIVSYLWIPDTDLASDVTRIVQGSVTAVAITAGGVFAVAKLQVFRDFAPHLIISHEISHRDLGDSYIHISVTANLHNIRYS